MSVDIKKAYEVLGSMVRRVNSGFGRNIGDTAILIETNHSGGHIGTDFMSGLSLNGMCLRTFLSSPESRHMTIVGSHNQMLEEKLTISRANAINSNIYCCI